MSFRLVPNSVTLDDLERRNSLNGSVISLIEFGSFRGGLRKSRSWNYSRNVGQKPNTQVAQLSQRHRAAQGGLYIYIYIYIYMYVCM